MRVFSFVVCSSLLAACGETATGGAVPDAFGGAAGAPVSGSPPAAGAEAVRDEMPAACKGAVLGGACDDSFLPPVAKPQSYPYRFACEANAAHDPMCRPRLTCVDRTWQRDEVYPTGPDGPGCDVFPPCSEDANGGLCEGSDGKLCLVLNDGPHCDQNEVFHGPIVLVVPQAGSACAEEDKQVYDCGMGGGDRRCLGGIWVVAVGVCF